jgi:hypothetical protein
MGEMADMSIDEVMDFEDNLADYRRGEIPFDEAVDKGIIDEATGEEY